MSIPGERDGHQAATAVRPAWQMRWLAVWMLFASTFVIYADRIGFSIAFTEMAQHAQLDQTAKGAVFSSFFYGYVLTQIPASWLVSYFGNRVVLTWSIGLATLLTFLTPVRVAPLPNGSPLWVFCIFRILVGGAQGAVFPCVHTELSRWRDDFGPTRFSLAVSLATSGMYMGSAIATSIVPSVIQFGGASMVFRLQTGLGALWLPCWLRFSASAIWSPRHGEEVCLEDSGSDKKEDCAAAAPGRVPWRKLLLLRAVWAIVAGNFSFHFVFFAVMNWMPTYFSTALHIDFYHMSQVKIVPYLSVFAFTVLSGMIGDFLIARNDWKVGMTRKFINSVGCAGMVVTLGIMPYFVQGVGSGVTALSLLLACAATTRGGWGVNHMDIAPRHAGAVMGLANTAGTVAGIAGVQATGVLLDAFPGEVGWHAVFFMWALVCLAAGLLFTWWGHGEELVH